MRELAPMGSAHVLPSRYIPKREDGWRKMPFLEFSAVRPALLTAPFRSCLHPPPNESETRPQDQKERERGSPEVCTFPNGFARLKITRSHACKNAVVFTEFCSFLPLHISSLKSRNFFQSTNERQGYRRSCQIEKKVHLSIQPSILPPNHKHGLQKGTKGLGW